MRDLASSAKWRDRFPKAGVREWFVHNRSCYYDFLASAAKSVNLWETTQVTYARSRTHRPFLMLPSILLCFSWFEYFCHGTAQLLDAAFGYERHQILFLVGIAVLCHTGAMFSAYTTRSTHSLVSLRVYLRLTGMDVCCGPPDLR
jgi:hypothetical protein